MASRKGLVVVILTSILSYPNVFAFQPITSPRRLRGTSAITPSQQQQQPLPPSSTTTATASNTMTSLAAFYDFSAVEAGSHLMSPSELVASASATLNLSSGLDSLSQALSMTPNQADALAGPLFGASLFPYLAFLYFLSRPQAACPKGVTVGFATCLLFVFLTIPAAIAAKVMYGVSLADSDWLHGSAESLLTLTNLVTVVAFRQALQAKEQKATVIPASVTSYKPVVAVVVVGTLLAALSAAVPALASDTTVHTPYLYGLLDLPQGWLASSNTQPDNALSIPCWIIHISSLVEFLVAMGFCWRWADVAEQPQWKGLTWGLLPLHSSGITACTYHLFYNQISILIPLQALLTTIGNTTAAYAAWRIAQSAGWRPTWLPAEWQFWSDEIAQAQQEEVAAKQQELQQEPSASFVGFEDLGQALAADNDYSFLAKLFVGSALASYVIKYGEVYFDFPFEANVFAGLSFILIPSLLNAYKWNQRSKDPSFEGWF